MSELEEKIKNYFKNKKEVIAVYLFGSYAEGRERDLSDIDIGIILDRRDSAFFQEKRDVYMVELGRILRKDIDSVILNSASEALLNIDLPIFMSDIDRQESILFNIQMAVQNCVDIAAHIISEEGYGVPGSTNEMLYMLEDNGYINMALAEKMVKAVGFRNLIVHEYGRIELEKVFTIAQKDNEDLNEYLRAIFIKMGIETP